MPRRATLLVASLAAALAAAAPAPASGDAHPGAPAASRAERLAEFRAALGGLGEWLQLPGLGPAWRPAGVDAEWRPYLHGSWTWTEDGWFWVSDEPWGWATYHYGRWSFHDELGWVWVPGSTWAPAWVAWRWGDDAVGWAPLPPRGAPLAAFWTFVPARQLVGCRADAVALPPSRVPSLLVRTRPGGARSSGAIASAPAPRS